LQAHIRPSSVGNTKGAVALERELELEGIRRRRVPKSTPATGYPAGWGATTEQQT